MLDQRRIASTLQKDFTRYKITNPDAHRCSRIIWSDILAYVKEQKKEWEAAAKKREAERAIDPSVSRMTDEERRQKLELKLDAMLSDPKTTAADIKEFRDYFGLGGKKSDTFVNTIDYKDAFPAYADRIKCVAELIKMRIEEANQGETDESGI